MLVYHLTTANFIVFVLFILIAVVESEKFINISGDIVLGALFPVHAKGVNGEDCGKIQIEDGIQPLEAMLYTVDRINRNPNILPGVRLGVLAFDTCDNPNYALEQTLKFVKGFIAHENEFHNRSEFQCADGSVPKFMGGHFDKVAAVLASRSSSVTLQIAPILRLFMVPQISYMATSSSLGDRARFPHFFRTVPSDVNQAKAMLKILKHFDWSYAYLVYTDTEYGKRGKEALEALAHNYNVCFGFLHCIDKDISDEPIYDAIIHNITQKSDIRVVVMFAEKVATLRVIRAARRLSASEQLVWIGSDIWSSGKRERELSPDEEHILEGALAVQPLYTHMAGFDDYFTNLTLEHVKVNPWFDEFWTEYHRCRGANGSVSNDEESQHFREDHCRQDDFNMKISSEMGYKQRKNIHFVRDAVYAVALALHDLQKEMCPHYQRGMVCEILSHIDGPLLSSYLAKVSFKDEAGNKFKFVKGREGPTRYSILNYQKKPDGYHWIIVGNYTSTSEGDEFHDLKLDDSLLRLRGQMQGKYGNTKDQWQFPTSRCISSCRSDQVRERLDSCCSRCRDCGTHERKKNENQCELCSLGTLPANNKTICERVNEKFVDYTHPWAACAVTVATFGIVVTIVVFGIFWSNRNTPIIKASGRELSCLMLFGILASFLMTFAIIAWPNEYTCALTRFGIGLCYTICYAALVTKTNRIHRIFNNATNSPHKPRYTSPNSQLTITGVLTAVEILINGAWLLRMKPKTIFIFPSREQRLIICEGFNDYSYIVGLVYPFFLIVICTYYAIKTRKCPEGFNETRRIAFTNYTTLVLWLAFVPLYLASADNAIRVVTLALSLSLSAFVQLTCLFLPKIYIVIIKPEKNTRELVMTRHRSSNFIPSPGRPTVVLNGNPHGVTTSSARESSTIE
ncbi:metabotropic glutamate receptor-like [Trichogramma pretiosum]|uniref:metabotropic glutamate receptor-like n=1 Tax=Trichogramma pretiosum TaxID=7493 RepID=UPI000C71C4E6|nr:metabotropic glutamate receptor-like [Trichogramma pretiosum]